MRRGEDLPVCKLLPVLCAAASSRKLDAVVSNIARIQELTNGPSWPRADCTLKLTGNGECRCQLGLGLRFVSHQLICNIVPNQAVDHCLEKFGRSLIVHTIASKAHIWVNRVGSRVP